MIEYTTEYGKIYVYESALPESECKSLITEISKVKDKQVIIRNQGLANKIYNKVKDVIITFPFKIQKVPCNVTITKNSRAIGLHKDTKNDCETHKLFIYLNPVLRGGTYFKKNETEWIYVENNIGSIVIFDMEIPHQGDPEMEKINKYVIGIRLVEEHVDEIP